MTTRQIDRFAESVGLAGKGYDELWCWSVEQPAAFWRGVWDFYGLSDRAADADGKPLGPDNSDVLADASMPGARWFPAMRLNYVDQVLAHADRPGAAIIGVTEDGERRELSWSQLADQVSRLAGTLEDCGVGEGDVVAAYLPDIPETVVAFSRRPRWAPSGRVAVRTTPPRVRPPGWDSSGPRRCSPRPATGSSGKPVDKNADSAELAGLLPGLAAHIVVTPVGGPPAPAGVRSYSDAVRGDGQVTPARRIRSSAVGAVQLRHHRQTERDRARSRRSGARTPESRGTALRSGRR